MTGVQTCALPISRHVTTGQTREGRESNRFGNPVAMTVVPSCHQTTLQSTLVDDGSGDRKPMGRGRAGADVAIGPRNRGDSGAQVYRRWCDVSGHHEHLVEADPRLGLDGTPGQGAVAQVRLLSNRVGLLGALAILFAVAWYLPLIVLVPAMLLQRWRTHQTMKVADLWQSSVEEELHADQALRPL